VPALRANDDAWSYTTEIILHGFPVDGDREKDVDSLAFPDLILCCIQSHLTLSQAKSVEKELVALVPQLRVEVSTSGGGEADGQYNRHSFFWHQALRQHLRIEFDAVSGWIIRRQFSQDNQWLTLYVCSERPFNMLLPPKTGWRSVHQTDPPQAAPILKYVMVKK
jgi:hypothetical protein